MKKTTFAAALARGRPLLLDGGLATQLEAQGCDINNALWSASLLSTDRAAIVEASRAFLDAGAECIATASYQASRDGFRAQGLSVEEADRLMLSSVDLALKARDEFLGDNPDTDTEPLIAASIGPWGATQHDGSEYTGDYAIGEAGLRAFHKERLERLDATSVDVLAVETIPSRLEAKVLCELLRHCVTPSWVSFCCRDGQRLSDGTPVEDVAVLFDEHPTVLALGINCTPPRFVVSLIRRIRSALPGKAIVAYPNSGEHYDVTDGGWSGTVSPLDCGEAVSNWIDAGAAVVGGCCRMGPAHIRAMAETIREKYA